MNRDCDILIVGAGTAGGYFGWQMARRGYSVIVAERNERQNVGQRLDVFHIDSVKFDEFGVPPPEADAPEFCVILETGISYSPEGKYPKAVRYPFHVMRLPLFLQRLFTMAESDGVEFEFSTEFSELLYRDGRISGAVVKRAGEEQTIRAGLVVDASGINAVVRTTLPQGYGVENFQTSPDEKFYVVLRYITWSDPDRPRTVDSEGWTFYKAWVAPSYHDRGAIIRDRRYRLLRSRGRGLPRVLGGDPIATPPGGQDRARGHSLSTPPLLGGRRRLSLSGRQRLPY